MEKHVELSKIAMMKAKAEAERQGLDVDEKDLAAEASFAQNATINLGGYTPHMMVTGTMPMPFYDIDAPGIQAVTGATQSSQSVFERALRLRQIALTAATQAIVENRIVRAQHTRPQRVATEELKPGVSEVEFHREDADGFGWRGPASLLKLQNNGTAVVEYNGRPYLIPLRNLRAFRGVYHMHYDETATSPSNRPLQELDAWCSMRRLMEHTEKMVPYKIETMGHLRNHRNKWHVLPKHVTKKQQEEILNDVVSAAKFLTSKTCHGVRLGRGLRKMVTPEGSTGTLVAWRKSTQKITTVDNPNGTDMNTSMIRNEDRDVMCYLYFYSYADEFVEPMVTTSLPSKARRAPAPPALPVQQMQETVDMDVDTEHRKRDGPETRTVTLGPESKKQRYGYMVKPSEYAADAFLTLHRQRWKYQPEASGPREESTEEAANHETHFLETQQKNELFYMNTPGWMADIGQGCIFKVDTEVDNIDEEKALTMWPEVEASDKKEVMQFVNEKAFKAVRRSELKEQCALIDAIWVRKFKRLADKTKTVKSRLCVRGCHDPWKGDMMTRSTTATRLSQRLILSAAACNDDCVESWDIAGAFLKGLTYEQLWKYLKKLGLKTVEREIAIVPPKNVWRHLKQLSSEFDIPEDELNDYVLLCLKPVYGLSEAPLAWQLFLHQCLRELGGIQSNFDECYWYWPKKTPGRLPSSALTTHVDDLGTHGKQRWLDETFEALVKKFGKLTRQTLPFVHCGCRYSRVGRTFKVDQADYVSMLQPIKYDKMDENQPLNAAGTTQLRSAVGALMWTGLTRPDLLAELSGLQSVMNKATVKHLKEANNLIERAKRDKDVAIYYRPFNTDQLRIVCVHDASAATATKNYAQEGVLVFLMEDHLDIKQDHIVCTDEFVSKYVSGAAHLLHVQSSKAKRVSYSTSHGETLAAMNGLECATLISTRLSEISHGHKQPTLQQLLAIQEKGNAHWPVDMMTDCRDYWSLSTGERSLPQDKSQRIYLLALREARACGRMRWNILTPTECMTSDALTKTMESLCLRHFLSSGVVKFWNTDHSMEMKRLRPSDTEASEDDLIAGDAAIIAKRSWATTTVAMTLATRRSVWPWMVMALVAPTPSTATSTSTSSSTTSVDTYNSLFETYDLVLLMVAILIAIAASSIAICVDRTCFRTTRAPKTNADDYVTHLEETMTEKNMELEVMRHYNQRLIQENDQLREQLNNSQEEFELLRRIHFPATPSRTPPPPVPQPPAQYPVPPTQGHIGTLYICRSRGNCYHKQSCPNALRTAVPIQPCSICFNTGA